MKSRKIIGFILSVLVLFCIPNVTKVNAAENISKGYVKVTSTLNARESPDLKSKSLAKLEPGTIVEVEEDINDFYKIKISVDGKTEEAYAYKEYIAIPSEENKELISAAVITKKGSSENRNYNMTLACKKLNGLTLKPGEEFNWYGENGVGKANEENGFKQAPIIVNKQTTMGYGGGVCQVSTALYNCIYNLDIKPDELHHHSLESTYVKKGMDATVAYPSKNFRFTNSKDYTIEFEAFTEGSRVIILAYKVEE